jgi:hypothetical protein
MIIIFGSIVVTLLIIFYSLFNVAVQYTVHQSTTYLLVWLFSLLSLNVIISFLIYGYYYYRTNINPYQGNAGSKGYTGHTGDIGTDITKFLCKNKN